MISQGYRKVSGDSCSITMPGAIDLNPRNESCRGLLHVPNAGAIFFIILIIVILAVVGTSWYLAGTNEDFRAVLARVIPEKFLPDRRTNLPSGNYQQLATPFEEDGPMDDARELHLDEQSSSD